MRTDDVTQVRLRDPNRAVAFCLIAVCLLNVM
jgi:hypothetical protein